MTVGNIVEWTVGEGEEVWRQGGTPAFTSRFSQVARDDVLAKIETDKAELELESPEDG